MAININQLHVGEISGTCVASKKNLRKRSITLMLRLMVTSFSIMILGNLGFSKLQVRLLKLKLITSVLIKKVWMIE